MAEFIVALCGACADVNDADPSSVFTWHWSLPIAVGDCSCGKKGVTVHPYHLKAAAPPKPPEPSCGACRFFYQSSVDRDCDGMCRRYPPTVFGSVDDEDTGETHIEQYWPNVTIDYWCGEFQAKPLPTPPAETSKVRQTVIEGRNTGEAMP